MSIGASGTESRRAKTTGTRPRKRQASVSGVEAGSQMNICLEESAQRAKGSTVDPANAANHYHLALLVELPASERKQSKLEKKLQALKPEATAVAAAWQKPGNIPPEERLKLDIESEKKAQASLNDHLTDYAANFKKMKTKYVPGSTLWDSNIEGMTRNPQDSLATLRELHKRLRSTVGRPLHGFSVIPHIELYLQAISKVEQQFPDASQAFQQTVAQSAPSSDSSGGDTPALSFAQGMPAADPNLCPGREAESGPTSPNREFPGTGEQSRPYPPDSTGARIQAPSDSGAMSMNEAKIVPIEKDICQGKPLEQVAADYQTPLDMLPALKQLTEEDIDLATVSTSAKMPANCSVQGDLGSGVWIEHQMAFSKEFMMRVFVKKRRSVLFKLHPESFEMSSEVCQQSIKDLLMGCIDTRVATEHQVHYQKVQALVQYLERGLNAALVERPSATHAAASANPRTAAKLDLCTLSSRITVAPSITLKLSLKNKESVTIDFTPRFSEMGDTKCRQLTKDIIMGKNLTELATTYRLPIERVIRLRQALVKELRIAIGEMSSLILPRLPPEPDSETRCWVKTQVMFLRDIMVCEIPTEDRFDMFYALRRGESPATVAARVHFPESEILRIIKRFETTPCPIEVVELDGSVQSSTSTPGAQSQTPVQAAAQGQTQGQSDLPPAQSKPR